MRKFLNHNVAELAHSAGMALIKRCRCWGAEQVCVVISHAGVSITMGSEGYERRMFLAAADFDVGGVGAHDRACMRELIASLFLAAADTYEELRGVELTIATEAATIFVEKQP